MKRDFGYLRARLLGTEISETDFCNATDGFVNQEEFLNHLRGRKRPFFFLDPGEHHEVVRALREFCPGAETRVITAADQSCDHIFDLLGSGPTYLGEQIDWHVDFKTGHRFDPRQYYADVRPARYPGGYDIKVPWELSRCQHFAWLGQAYWFTEDEKYAQEFVDQVSNWIEENPPQFGVNWACTMDVSIRAVNWLWGYYFFKNSPTLNDGFLLALFRSLLVHGRHIFRNLENTTNLTNNHYLSNLVGLVYLGIMCPEFKEAGQWREFGLRELESEMFKQVYPDGVDFEASTSYHRLATEMFLSAVLLAQLNRYEFVDAPMKRLEKMLEFVMVITKPDGSVPLIGDNDNGRLHRLKVWDPPEREWVDFRYLLAIGAVLFRREDFAKVAGDQWEEAIWLLGEGALDYPRQVLDAREPAPVHPSSRAFTDAGLYVMRRKDWYLAVTAGPNGQNGNGGHAHNDKLSFEVYTNGQTWILDPGICTYTADYEARSRLRSTRFHNSVVVDGQEQNPLSSATRDVFRLPDLTQSKGVCWVTSDRSMRFVGEHLGYSRMTSPVVHRRSIFLGKSLSTWILHDQLLGRKRHSATTHLHFAPDLRVETDVRFGDRPGIRLHSDRNELHIIALRGHSRPPLVHTGAICAGYGLQKPALAIAWVWDEGCLDSILAISAGPSSSEQIEATFGEYLEDRDHVANS